MIYLSKNQNISKDACDRILESIHDNLKLLGEFTFNFEKAEFEFENEEYLVARSLSFASVVIEKLVLINLYSRNPLLVIANKSLPSEALYKDLDYAHYNDTWLYKSGPNLKGLDAMWSTLVGVVQAESNDVLSDFDFDFKYLKEVRNKYFHAFIDNLSYDSFHLIRYNLWLLIIRLIEILPSYLAYKHRDILENAGLTDGRIDTLENFNFDEEVKLLLQKFSGMKKTLIEGKKDTLEKRIYLLKKLYSSDHLEKHAVRTFGASIVQITPNGEEIEQSESFLDFYTRSEITIDCPECLSISDVPRTGYLNLSVDGIEYDIDDEGDAETWKEPVSIDLSFDHFYCTNCAVHSTDRYTLEQIGYREIFKLDFNARWDINEGVTSLYEAHLGPYSISDY